MEIGINKTTGSSLLTELEVISGSGFGEPQNAQDAELHAPMILMIGIKMIF
jgi:hypothetical protein